MTAPTGSPATEGDPWVGWQRDHDEAMVAASRARAADNARVEAERRCPYPHAHPWFVGCIVDEGDVVVIGPLWTLEDAQAEATTPKCNRRDPDTDQPARHVIGRTVAPQHVHVHLPTTREDWNDTTRWPVPGVRYYTPEGRWTMDARYHATLVWHRAPVADRPGVTASTVVYSSDSATSATTPPEPF